ncbi:hypothetical protein V3C99_016535 [Haemonchus contortus]|uniref:Uncharacterized protein n=1 Tax=Haemonchus contortus TaxID=6289 RepID=A0A7I4YZC6_HAECO
MIALGRSSLQCETISDEKSSERSETLPVGIQNPQRYDADDDDVGHYDTVPSSESSYRSSTTTPILVDTWWRSLAQPPGRLLRVRPSGEAGPERRRRAPPPLPPRGRPLTSRHR